MLPFLGGIILKVLGCLCVGGSTTETGDPQLVAEPGVRRNHGETMRKSRRGHSSGTTFRTGSTFELLSANY